MFVQLNMLYDQRNDSTLYSTINMTKHKNISIYYLLCTTWKFIYVFSDLYTNVVCYIDTIIISIL